MMNLLKNKLFINVTFFLSLILGLWLLFFFLFHVFSFPFDFGMCVLFSTFGISLSSLILGSYYNSLKNRKEIPLAIKVNYWFGVKHFLFFLPNFWMIIGWTFFLSRNSMFIRTILFTISIFGILFIHIKLRKNFQKRFFEEKSDFEHGKHEK